MTRKEKRGFTCQGKRNPKTVDSYRKRFQNGYANIERVARGQLPWWIIPEMRDLFPEVTVTD